MRGKRLLIILTTAGLLGGCATTGKPPIPGRGNCTDGVALDDIPLPVPVTGWTPADVDPGLLRIHYRWTGQGVYAIGVLYVSTDTVKIPFIIKLPEVPDTWTDDPSLPRAREGIPAEWFDFFAKLRTVRHAQPGGFVCRGRSDCAMTPDSPPPEVMGSISSGGSGSYAMASGSPAELYAQAMKARTTATDAAGAATGHETSGERGRIVNQIVSSTCRGVRALLSTE